MRRRALLARTLAIGLSAAAAGCERRAEPGGTGEAAVREASATWDRAHNAGDLAALMKLYAEDAVSMPFNRPALEGRAAIESDFREFFAAYRAEHQTRIVSLRLDGDLAVERGQYTFAATPKAAGAALRESGKHIVVRRRIDGAWRIQWEIWNTDAPA